MEKDIFQNIEEMEKEIQTRSLAENKELYEYYYSSIIALGRSINNSFSAIPNNGIDNNYKLLNYIVAPKFISISKNAMDMAIKGHPIESFNLTRLIFELIQITQYLTRHCEDIMKYYSGKIKPDEIRKKSEKEMPSKAGGKLFGLLSNYSHSTKDVILITLKQNKDKIDSPIVVDNKILINHAIHGVTIHTWGFYFGYRTAFHGDNITDDIIREKDAFLFDKTRIKHLFSNIQEVTMNEVSDLILKLDTP